MESHRETTFNVNGGLTEKEIMLEGGETNEGDKIFGGERGGVKSSINSLWSVIDMKT